MDHKSNSARDLSDQMAEKCSETDPQDEKKAVETIQLGLRLGQYNFNNVIKMVYLYLSKCKKSNSIGSVSLF